MPNRSDAEWCALDEQLARLMGWCLWDELPEDARQAYCYIGGSKPDEWELETYHRLQWWYIEENGLPWNDYSVDEWRPHNDISQAIEVKDCIVRQKWPGCRFYLDSVQHLDSRAGFGREGQIYRGSHKTDAGAICLAAEQWANAQKEKQNAR